MGSKVLKGAQRAIAIQEQNELILTNLTSAMDKLESALGKRLISNDAEAE